MNFILTPIKNVGPSFIERFCDSVIEKLLYMGTNPHTSRLFIGREIFFDIIFAAVVKILVGCVW